MGEEAMKEEINKLMDKIQEAREKRHIILRDGRICAVEDLLNQPSDGILYDLGLLPEYLKAVEKDPIHLLNLSSCSIAIDALKARETRLRLLMSEVVKDFYHGKSVLFSSRFLEEAEKGEK